MLTLLKIKNIALIDELSIEFGSGLNLLTGETGSGKSIIVDSLGALTGERVSGDLIKEGSESAIIEGLFSIIAGDELTAILNENGIAANDGELIVRRELSAAGKNRIFINDQLITQGLLKRIGSQLVDIHGQGEHADLYDTSRHIDLLDEYAGVADLTAKAADTFDEWAAIKWRLASLERDEAEKLRSMDMLRFQTNEITAANLSPGEDIELEEEKRRLSDVEKLTAASTDAYSLLYDNVESTAATLEKAERRVTELAEFESTFNEYAESIATARAVID